jgi:hypothetical protein
MKTILNCTDIAKIPKKRTNMENLFCTDILLIRNKIYPINKFKQAHNTLTVGEDRPLPGGCEKGLGKESPETP